MTSHTGATRCETHRHVVVDDGCEVRDCDTLHGVVVIECDDWCPEYER